ncbi:protein FAM178B isoform X4 [Bos taurus]|uniref:Family with sequence similarity 178 member B n=1 Tax=Bos taurus TaxID=9913 RepID=A0AAA9SGG7_BOVIN|nr:protein FAM178B isoform X4 [Bos taurus]
MLSRVKLFSWRGKTWEQPARCPVGPCLPPPLPRVLAGVELPAGGLLLGLWAAKLALCVHSCEPGAGRTVVETIHRLGRPEQGSTALVLLSSLCQLLSLMRPSSLRRYLGPETVLPGQEQQPKASAQLDHKACYLCHSLLTLAGVVVSCQDITPDQWGELQLLCMQLDRHINTHIRESPQAMHQTTLKDLAAQTYIRWQELLAHCQPQAQYFSLWEGV